MRDDLNWNAVHCAQAMTLRILLLLTPSYFCKWMLDLVITVKMETVTSDGGGIPITNSVIASTKPICLPLPYPGIVPFVLESTYWTLDTLIIVNFGG
jgi:hypothetical protein